MPYRPKRPCAYPGCPNLTDGEYCDVHRKLVDRQYDRSMRSRDAARFYHSADWRRKRNNFLAEHPFCEECLRHGRLTMATVVDHMIPLGQGGAALDDDNLQALCASCHGAKSIREGSRYGRR